MLCSEVKICNYTIKNDMVVEFNKINSKEKNKRSYNDEYRECTIFPLFKFSFAFVIIRTNNFDFRIADFELLIARSVNNFLMTKHIRITNMDNKLGIKRIALVISNQKFRNLL